MLHKNVVILFDPEQEAGQSAAFHFKYVFYSSSDGEREDRDIYVFVVLHVLHKCIPSGS